MNFKDIIESAISTRDSFERFEEKIYGKKWDVNQIMLGLSVDVGDLIRLVQEKKGTRPRNTEDLDGKIAHELCDILWVVLVLAKELDVDLTHEFPKNMLELQEIIENKINNN